MLGQKFLTSKNTFIAERAKPSEETSKGKTFVDEYINFSSFEYSVMNSIIEFRIENILT